MRGHLQRCRMQSRLATSQDGCRQGGESTGLLCTEYSPFEDDAWCAAVIRSELNMGNASSIRPILSEMSVGELEFLSSEILLSTVLNACDNFDFW